MSHKIREYQAGDEKDILELFEIAFGKKLSYEFWSWRFLKNPFQSAEILLAYDNSKLVGHYATCPINLMINQVEVKSSISMTTMTHPEHGGQGIFSNLAESLYLLLRDRFNQPFVWGFPNKNSHYAFVHKLGWLDMYTIHTLRLDTSLLKHKSNLDYLIENTFSKEHCDAVNYKDYTVKTNRSLNYLNWRYSENPINNYKIVSCKLDGIKNFAVFKEFNNGTSIDIDIVELESLPSFDIIAALIQGIRESVEISTKCYFNIWMPIWDKKHTLLEKLGFHSAEPITYFGAKPVLDNKTEILLNPKSWYVSMGDSDIY